MNVAGGRRGTGTGKEDAEYANQNVLPPETRRLTETAHKHALINARSFGSGGVACGRVFLGARTFSPGLTSRGAFVRYRAPHQARRGVSYGDCAAINCRPSFAPLHRVPLCKVLFAVGHSLKRPTCNNIRCNL